MVFLQPLTNSQNTSSTPLVRVIDDNEEIRKSLEFLLRCEGYDVAMFENAEAFLSGDTPSRPGCLILDVQMPGLSGIELFNVLKMRGYDVPIIFLTAHADVGMAVYAMREGACDFHQKPLEPETLLPAVARAIERDRAKKSGVTSLKDEVRKYESLTEREEQIARLVAAGFVNRTIAERLNISRRTVEHYRASALQKIGIREFAELSAFFARMDAWREKAGAGSVVPRL